MTSGTKTVIKAANELQPGDLIETSAGFITVIDVRVWRDGAVEVMYPSLDQMLTVQTFIENGCEHVRVAAD